MKGIDVAYAMVGTTEFNKTRLMNFFKERSIDNDILIDPTKLAWCAAFVNACEREAGNPGTGKLSARMFKTYGAEVNLEDIQHGDIVVFKRGKLPWQGHVTYFVKFGNPEKTHLTCIGGNQNDMVCESSFNVKDLLFIRSYEKYKLQEKA
jgi:uncharacterized protein (TIGR02594 family)